MPDERPRRNHAIDAVRGLVMVLMVLDHARDFFFGWRVDPMDLDEASPILFFTRWITHFCAPGFVLLAGAAAYLYGRQRSAAERRRFLLTRGLWLIVLEVTVVRLAWIPEPYYRFTVLQVIWAIGCSMVLLAPLSALSPRWLVAGGALMVALHDLLDPIHASSFGDGSFFWAVLHERARFEPLPGHQVGVMYPLIPWVGVMAIGFGLGQLFTREASERRSWLLRIGLSLTLGFLLVRGMNVYGDPRPWTSHVDGTLTVLDFLDCEKYPPSLSYLLMTLGPILLVLWLFERFAWFPSSSCSPCSSSAVCRSSSTSRTSTSCASPCRLRLRALRRRRARAAARRSRRQPGAPAVGDLRRLALGAPILYPVCRAYGRFKARRSGQWWWLRYL